MWRGVCALEKLCVKCPPPSTFVRASARESELSGFGPNIWYQRLVVLGVAPLAGGVPAVAAFVGGCAMELRAVCQSEEMRGAAAVMADAEAVHGESATSAADVEALAARLRRAASTVRPASGRVRGGGDRRQRARSSPRSWGRRRWEQQRHSGDSEQVARHSVERRRSRRRSTASRVKIRGEIVSTNLDRGRLVMVESSARSWQRAAASAEQLGSHGVRTCISGRCMRIVAQAVEFACACKFVSGQVLWLWPLWRDCVGDVRAPACS